MNESDRATLTYLWAYQLNLLSLKEYRQLCESRGVPCLMGRAGAAVPPAFAPISAKSKKRRKAG